MRISDWSSDVCSSDLREIHRALDLLSLVRRDRAAGERAPHGDLLSFHQGPVLRQIAPVDAAPRRDALSPPDAVRARMAGLHGRSRAVFLDAGDHPARL